MYKGYKLIQEKYIKDVNSDCILLEHEKTGARAVSYTHLLWSLFLS